MEDDTKHVLEDVEEVVATEDRLVTRRNTYPRVLATGPKRDRVVPPVESVGEATKLGEQSQEQRRSTFHSGEEGIHKGMTSHGYPQLTPLPQQPRHVEEPQATLKPPPTTWQKPSIPPDWKPTLLEMWVQFPGQEGPVWGWFREFAATSPNAFFGSDGEVTEISRPYLDEYICVTSSPQPIEGRPNAVRLSPFLFPAVRDILRTYNAVGDHATGRAQPVTTQIEWRRLMTHGTTMSLPYLFQCTSCGVERQVRRMDYRIVDKLPPDYCFECNQVGLTCHLPHGSPASFIAPPPIPNSSSSAGTPPLLQAPDLPQHDTHPVGEKVPNEIHVIRDNVTDKGWRKRLKHWTGVRKYEGAPSLVQLRGWRGALLEVFEEEGVPEGRDQVSGATQFLAGKAHKWWSELFGQPLATSMSSFQDMYDALEVQFIPRDIRQKAMASWNNLRQRGTVADYMKKVDELAVVHPLGQVGEFWQAWSGLKPELKAEVDFALDQQGRETCSRAELRKLLQKLELKFPPSTPLPRPFFPRSQLKHTEARVVSSLVSPPFTITCWICDKTGHRATECSRRKATGCPRCGSRAHKLTFCPQRPGAPSERERPTGGSVSRRQAKPTGK